MSDKWNALSDEAKMWAYSIGYVGVCIGVCYIMYKWLAVLIGKSVAAELIKAGVITVL